MPTRQILNFRSAEISDKKILRVYYYALHPQTNTLKRVVIKCNRYRSHKDNLTYARRLRDEITRKLYSGWNPFIDESMSRGYTTIDKALDLYMKEKARELRPDSVHQYSINVRTLKNWLKERRPAGYYVASFSESDALALMDYFYMEKNVAAVTYNNYRQFYKVVWNWFMVHQFCTKNPFNIIKGKRAEPKQRDMIEHDERQKIARYLEEHNYPLLCFCKIMFSCLMRPKEILMTRIENIDLDKQEIYVPGSIAKNHKARVATIPNALVNDLRRLELHKYPGNYYAFSLNFKPGRVLEKSKNITTYWYRLRKKMGLGKKSKLYSFRDSGITEDLRAGITPIMVRDHADHSSLSVTNTYTRHANPELHRIIKEKSAEF